MVHEHVAPAQDPEDPDLAVLAGQPGRDDARPGLVLQVRAVEAQQRPQAAQVERPGHHVEVLVVEVELPLEELTDLVGHRGLDLEAHGLAEAPAPQLHLDGGQQVVGLLLLEGEVGVAGDPERMVLHHLHAREERVEVGGDDLLERHEALAVGHDHEAGQQRRDLDPGEAAQARRGVVNHDGQVEREVRDVGERVAGIDRQRGEHGEDALVELGRRGTCGRRRRARPTRRSGCRRRPSAGTISSRKTCSARVSSLPTRSRISSSCWPGVRPSGVAW